MTLQEAGFRFRWVERDIKDIAAIVDGLVVIAEKNVQSIAKINRNILILGCLIIGLGIGSKMIDGQMLDYLKRLIGL